MRESNSKPLVFLAFANSSANPLPSLAEEWRRLTNIFEAAAQKGICDLLVRPYLTVAELLDTFEQPAYHKRIALFHYAGHAESYALLLEEAGVAHAGGVPRATDWFAVGLSQWLFDPTPGRAVAGGVYECRHRHQCSD